MPPFSEGIRQKTLITEHAASPTAAGSDLRGGYCDNGRLAALVHNLTGATLHAASVMLKEQRPMLPTVAVQKRQCCHGTTVYKYRAHGQRAKKPNSLWLELPNLHAHSPSMRHREHIKNMLLH